MPISNDLKRRLNELVDETDLIKSDLPALIGIGNSTFFRIIDYGIVPRMAVLIKLADYFDVSLEYLLARTNDLSFSHTGEHKSFYERLDELKEEKNLTYYAIGKKLLLDTSLFTQWKSHGHLPSLDYLIMLAEFFGTSIDYLIGRTDDR